MISDKGGPYRIFWTNMGWHSDMEFMDVQNAVSYGRSKGFDFQVRRKTVTGEELIASWTVFGGLKYYSDVP